MRLVRSSMCFLALVGANMGLPNGPAFASSSQAGRVTTAIVNRSGRFFFHHDGARSAPPACQVHQRWVVDLSTAHGQAMMALVLTAQAQNKPVVVHGTGDCRDWGTLRLLMSSTFPSTAIDVIT